MTTEITKRNRNGLTKNIARTRERQAIRYIEAAKRAARAHRGASRGENAGALRDPDDVLVA